VEARLRLIQALSHPLRIAVLGSLESGGRTASELAKGLDVDAHLLAYHLEVLRDFELIRPARETPRPERGLVYELAPPPFTKLLPQPGQAVPRGKTSGPVLQAMLGSAIAALEAGVVDAGGANHLSHISGVLDDRGWQEVVDVLSESEERISQAMAGAAERMADTGADGVGVTIALAGVSKPPSAGKGRATNGTGKHVLAPPMGRQSSQGKKSGR
jgi:hypothetical protein